MAEPESNTDISVTVKTPKEKHTFQINPEVTVQHFKEQIAETFKATLPQLCLIFAGKILKDTETLSSVGIKDGLTVHLVIKASNKSTTSSTPAPAGTTSTPSSQPDPSTTPAPTQNSMDMLGGLGGLGGFGGLGGGNLADMQSQMQQQMARNPDSVRQMLDNPMVQQVLSNPEIMRTMITSNPQMRELMDRNPEINHMLNNPDIMRQTLELARNPAAMQEMMRQQDRAMSNLESLPGGMNHLQRIYRDIQEPLMSATGSPNPFAALANSSGGSTGTNPQEGLENNDPLPNPWAARSTTTTPSSNSSTTTSSGTTTAGGSDSMSSMFGSPGVQSMVNQMMQNPQLMQNMMSSPYVQTMMNQMMSNPELSNQILANNPLFASNPQLADSMRQNMPQMMERMRSPEMQSMLTNPRAMEAMMQIQHGLQQLQQEAPGLISTPGLVPGFPQSGAPSVTTPTTATTNTPATSAMEGTSSTTATTTTTTTSPSAGGLAGQAPNADMANMMAQMLGMMSAGGGGTGMNPAASQPPEQRFASQLEQLANMGFVDRQANIQALLATYGDLSAAIDRLLSQR